MNTYYSTFDNHSPTCFWCPACAYIAKLGAESINETLELFPIKPENTPHYECQICKVDYRDFFKDFKGVEFNVNQPA